VRGGNWTYQAVAARADFRQLYPPAVRTHFVGFRLVRTLT
jgi:formylglycine-generating enzyme required for sulfatase activity